MKALKWLGISLAVVIVLAIAVVVAFISFFDPNDFKDRIISQVREETGRTLAIPGELDIGFWPKLYLTTGEVSLSNAPGFGDDPMFATRSFAISVSTPALLKGRVEMDTIKLDGARFVLARNADGVSNLDDLPRSEDEPAAIDLGSLIIGGVEITDASLLYTDESTPRPQRVEISGINFTTGALTMGEPIAIKLAATAKSTVPALDADINLDGTVNYDLDNEQFVLDPLSLVTALRGQRLPGGRAEVRMGAVVELDLDNNTARISGLNLDGLGTRVTGQLEASELDRTMPGAAGELHVAGDDLALLFRVAELEAASQLQGVRDRAFSLDTRFTRQAGSGDVAVPELNLKLLGANVTGVLNARNTDSDTPAVAGKLNANGPDLPAVLAVLSQFQAAPEAGGDKPMLAASRALNGIRDKSFDMAIDFDADMKSGAVKVSELNARGGGYTARGSFDASGINGSRGSVKGQLNVEGNPAGPLLALSGNEGLSESIQTLKINAGVNGSTDNLALSPVSIEAGVKRGNNTTPITITAGEARASLSDETVSLKNLQVNGMGLDVSGNIAASKINSSRDFTGDVSVEPFNLRDLMVSLKQELPEMSDAKALTRVGLKTKVSGSATSFALKEIDLVLDESHVTGNVSLAELDPPALDFGINVDRINADRYLPAAAEEAAPAPGGAVAEAADLPVDTLRALRAKGALTVDDLTISGARLQDVRVALDARDGLITVNPQAALYEGTYKSAIALDARGAMPSMKVDIDLAGVNVDPMLKDVMAVPESPLAGRASFSAALSGSGADGDALREHLSGSGNFSVVDGIYRGVDIPSVLAQLEVMIESKRFRKVVSEGDTAFDELSGTVQIDKGVARNDDMVMLGHGFRVDGKGTLIDMATDRIDYGMVVSVDKRRITQDAEDYNLGGYSLPIRCKGLAQDASCLPDTTEIAKNLVQNTVKDVVQDVIKGEDVGKALKGLFGR
ncbi:MAG: AsmA family protein [Gammaproteobacteria bacterium]|nr:AsmA family protein [Gammaproteobacteria bacterium]